MIKTDSLIFFRGGGGPLVMVGSQNPNRCIWHVVGFSETCRGRKFGLSLTETNMCEMFGTFCSGVFLCILLKYLWYLLSRCRIKHPFHLASLDDLQGLQPRHVKSLGAQVMHRPRYDPPLYYIYLYYIMMTLPFNEHLMDIPDVFQLRVYNVMFLHVRM